MWHDVRYALRTLRKAPVFAAAAVLTLALGIGANTAIFSVVNAVLVRPLPYADPGRLVQLTEKNDRLNLPNFGSSILNYLSWREMSHSFESLGVIGGGSNYTLTGRGEPENYPGATISPSILPILGIHPVRGRGFAEGEDRPGAAPVAMISESVWRQRFAGENVVGRTVTLNGAMYTIAGVAPAALKLLTGADIWTPQIIDPGREIRLNHVVTVIGRLRPGVTFEQAQADMDDVYRRMIRLYPEIKDWGVRVQTFFRLFVSPQLQTALLVLLGAVVFVLLIACANVANLLLSRAAARQKEVAVRTAIGATRARIVRQLLTENLLLAAAGGGAGLLAAFATVRVIGNSLPPNVLPVSDISIDSGVLLFSAVVTLVTGALFGLAPAWQIARVDLNTFLKQGGRSGGGDSGPMARNLLVGAELALATMLLIGAGLLMESLLHMQRAPLGFRADGLLTFQLQVPPVKYPGIEKQWGFYRSLIGSLETLPGARGAAVSSGLPMGGGNYTKTPVMPVGSSALPAGAAIPIDWRCVSPGYFRLMGIPLVRGRDFDEHDRPGVQPPVILSQESARKLWGAEDPVGRAIQLGGGRRFVVAGVVGDARNIAVNLEPAPAMYFPAAMRLWPVMDVAVRVSGNPESILPAVRAKVREMDADLPVSAVRTMDQWISVNAAQPRLNAELLGCFAAAALLIAALGVYGVLSYSVNRRTREIGLRMALGAESGSVVKLVLREGMSVGLAGIGAGLLAAMALSRVLNSMLFGVEARDPLTFAAVGGLLATIALAACLIPARRASRVDPVVALREE